MSKRILTTPLNKDPGGEGGLGYDYQWLIGARMAIEMLCDKEIGYIVCEFREDMVRSACAAVRHPHEGMRQGIHRKV